jgi:hypothetical protein
MFLQKHSKTTPMETKKGLYKKKSFFSTSTVGCDLMISMGICGIFFGIFNSIDFEIIAFEGRRQCFLGPRPAWSAAFDSRLHHKIKIHKVELLEIHNV